MPARKPAPLYMAVDFGTSHIRAAIGRSTGRPIAVARIPVSYSQPKDGSDTALDFSPAQVWKLVGTASKRALKESGASAKEHGNGDLARDGPRAAPEPRLNEAVARPRKD